MTQGRWSRSAKRKLKESAAGRRIHIKYIKLSKPEIHCSVDFLLSIGDLYYYLDDLSNCIELSCPICIHKRLMLSS